MDKKIICHNYQCKYWDENNLFKDGSILIQGCGKLHNENELIIGCGGICEHTTDKFGIKNK